MTSYPRVKLFSFGASATEDKFMALWAIALALHEEKELEEVEKEMKWVIGHLFVPRSDYPFEVWGPQGMADRINAAMEAAKSM